MPKGLGIGSSTEQEEDMSIKKERAKKLIDRHIPLSAANLKEVYEWAEGNLEQPLALSYIGLSSAIGIYSFWGVVDGLVISPKNDSKAIGLSLDIEYLTMLTRDTLGRAILKKIKEGPKWN